MRYKPEAASVPYNFEVKPKISNQIMSMASTKNVVMKGRMRVSQGQCATMATTSAATETKNNNQYNPLFFLRTSIG